MLKNKMAGLMLETGVGYDTKRLHGKKYFQALLESTETKQILPPDLQQLIAFDRCELERVKAIDRGIVARLVRDPSLSERLLRLQSIRGVGEVTALTWALETGEPARFPNERHAISYCGLCSAQRESAGKQQRGPLSKQRNAFLQTALLEAAHLAVQHNDELKAIYQAQCGKGPKNRATLDIARRLVRRLLAIDRDILPSAPRRRLDGRVRKQDVGFRAKARLAPSQRRVLPPLFLLGKRRRALGADQPVEK